MNDLVTFALMGSVLLGGGVSVGLASALLAARAARVRAWRYAARVAQLTDVAAHKDLAGRVLSLTGRSGRLSVRLEAYRRGKHETGTRIVISGLWHGTEDLTFRREGLGTRVDKALGQREIALGDPVFDEVAYLQGSPQLARALLDAETRRLLIRLLDGHYTVSSHRPMILPTQASLADGELRIELRTGPFGRDVSQVRVVLPDALRVAGRLVRPVDLVARLAENLREEPLAEVRLGILQTLLERHLRHPMVREALVAALKDTSDEIRLQAALAVGIGGWDTLLEIASSEGSDDRLAARAIRGLDSHLSVEQAKAILARALRLRRTATARACLESLGQYPGPDASAFLAKVLAVEKGDLAAVAARALASSAGAAAEDTLLQALEGHEPEALSGVADALGRVGTAAAVMPLRDASMRIPDDAFRRAARQAVAEIQTRLQGASPGQLSLASGESGQVALVDDDARGSVSLTDEAKTAAPPERPR